MRKSDQSSIRAVVAVAVLPSYQSVCQSVCATVCLYEFVSFILVQYTTLLVFASESPNLVVCIHWLENAIVFCPP